MNPDDVGWDDELEDVTATVESLVAEPGCVNLWINARDILPEKLFDAIEALYERGKRDGILGTPECGTCD